MRKPRAGGKSPGLTVKNSRRRLERTWALGPKCDSAETSSDLSPWESDESLGSKDGGFEMRKLKIVGSRRTFSIGSAVSLDSQTPNEGADTDYSGSRHCTGGSFSASTHHRSWSSEGQGEKRPCSNGSGQSGGWAKRHAAHAETVSVSFSESDSCGPLRGRFGQLPHRNRRTDPVRQDSAQSNVCVSRTMSERHLRRRIHDGEDGEDLKHADTLYMPTERNLRPSADECSGDQCPQATEKKDQLARAHTQSTSPPSQGADPLQCIGSDGADVQINDRMDQMKSRDPNGAASRTFSGTSAENATAQLLGIAMATMQSCVHQIQAQSMILEKLMRATSEISRLDGILLPALPSTNDLPAAVEPQGHPALRDNFESSLETGGKATHISSLPGHSIAYNQGKGGDDWQLHDNRLSRMERIALHGRLTQDGILPRIKRQRVLSISKAPVISSTQSSTFGATVRQLSSWNTVPSMEQSGGHSPMGNGFQPAAIVFPPKSAMGPLFGRSETHPLRSEQNLARGYFEPDGCFGRNGTHGNGNGSSWPTDWRSWDLPRGYRERLQEGGWMENHQPTRQTRQPKRALNMTFPIVTDAVASEESSQNDEGLPSRDPRYEQVVSGSPLHERQNDAPWVNKLSWPEGRRLKERRSAEESHRPTEGWSKASVYSIRQLAAIQSARSMLQNSAHLPTPSVPPASSADEPGSPEEKSPWLTKAGLQNCTETPASHGLRKGREEADSARVHPRQSVTEPKSTEPSPRKMDVASRDDPIAYQQAPRVELPIRPPEVDAPSRNPHEADESREMKFVEPNVTAKQSSLSQLLRLGKNLQWDESLASSVTALYIPMKVQRLSFARRYLQDIINIPCYSIHGLRWTGKDTLELLVDKVELAHAANSLAQEGYHMLSDCHPLTKIAPADGEGGALGTVSDGADWEEKMIRELSSLRRAFQSTRSCSARAWYTKSYYRLHLGCQQ